MKRILLQIFIFTIFSFSSVAQDTLRSNTADTIDFSNYSLEELIKMKSTYKSTEIEKLINESIEISARKPLSLKKSPSVVSVLTTEEIERSGSNNLMDLLELIPGIQFNVDVLGTIGISIRGLWSQEGKILLLVDGQEINEIAYGSIQFNQQYPVSQIKRIEVIRGPGSASYGGYAEYAVINVITKDGSDLNGLHVSTLVGQTALTYAQQNISISYGQKIKDFSYSLSGYYSRGQRSDQQYSDIYGNSYSMKGNSQLNSFNLNIGANYKGFSMRFIKDDSYMTQRDNYVSNLSKPDKQYFLNSLAELKYQNYLSKKFQLLVKVNFKNGEPWKNTDVKDSMDYSSYYNIITNRYRANVSGIIDINRIINLTIGLESFYDQSTTKLTPDTQIKANYLNNSAFIQALIKTRFANVTIGGRYDRNTSFGYAFNPRIGVTKKISIFNFKALYASSFRAPAIENILNAINNTIAPEKSATLEFEVATQINRNSYLSLNVYDIKTKNAIRYFIFNDSINNIYIEGYENHSSRIGTKGLEIEYKYISKKWTLSSSYSFYSADRFEDFDSIIQVKGSAYSNLGIANHKITLMSSINFGEHFFVTPSVIILGNRYGFNSVDSLGVGILNKYDPQISLNIYFSYKNLIKGLSLGCGVKNILNEEILYIQPYNSLHNALPGMGRQFNLNLTYLLPLKN